MDFAYHYTEEQERFRREVVRWLDSHGAADGPADPDDRHAELRRALARKGWLASIDPADTGDAGLTPEHAAVLLEELQRRGVGSLLSGPSAELRRAVRARGTVDQSGRLLPAIAGGDLTVWRPLLDFEAELDPGDLRIRAYQDGDDYLLDGDALFSGAGRWPDLLWTLAVGDPEAPPAESTIALLVSGSLAGIGIETPRRLGPDASHRVTFDRVRVPRSSLLGREGEGWADMRAAVTDAPNVDAAPPEDRDVEDLLRYATTATRDGVALRDQPVFQQLLMEAVVASRLTRLFRMRDAWMRASGRPLTYHALETARWERRAAMRLAQIARAVAGPFALLDRTDPRAPSWGRLELHQRRSLAEQNPTGTPEAAAAAMAQRLGLGERKGTARGA